MMDWLLKFKYRKQSRQADVPPPPPHQKLENLHHSIPLDQLDEVIDFLQSLLGENDDLVIRKFKVGGQVDAAIIYFSSMVDKTVIHMDILKPLMNIDPVQGGNGQLIDQVWNQGLYLGDGHGETNLSELTQAIVRGDCSLFVSGSPEGYILSTRFVEKRSIEQPQTEQVIRGAREGFIEQLDVNLSLLRYRLQSPDFHVRTVTVGRVTKSKVAICYIEGIVNDDLVQEAIRRITEIDTDGILDSGYVEQYIEDDPFSPFPQVQNTERPDQAAFALLEGRVVILVDGSPFSLIVPTVFSQFYHTMDDYTERFLMGSLVRFIRLVALVFSLFFPSLYVSVISFNPELLPTDFAVAVAGGRAGVPFPAVMEVFLLEIAMEVLREATIRLPQLIGGALSIVGVLVVGEAAVSAGISSPITVVIVALTTIGSFATPAYNGAIALRMLRFPLIILSGIFGLYGVMIGLIMIINHLISLRSFGVPYMAPLVPGSTEGIKDLMIRGPLWWLKRRPAYLKTRNKKRMPDTGVKTEERPVLKPGRKT